MCVYASCTLSYQMIRTSIILLAFLVSQSSKAQEEISNRIYIDSIIIRNGSFEKVIESDTRHQYSYNNVVIPEWNYCGSYKESPPYIHSNAETKFSIYTEAFQGNKFIALVVRANGTWHQISQKLSRQLTAGKMYGVNFSICHSTDMKSAVRDYSPREAVNFDKPIILKIYGGNDVCNTNEELYSSPPINHTDWRNYSIQLNPKKMQIGY